jgi:hypothetical protein
MPHRFLVRWLAFSEWAFTVTNIGSITFPFVLCFHYIVIIGICQE